MSFLEKLQTSEFWKNVAKISIPFFIIFSVVFFLAKNSSIFFNEGFNAAIENSFSNGKWKPFFGYKIILSFLYGIWMANKNMR